MRRQVVRKCWLSHLILLTCPHVLGADLGTGRYAFCPSFSYYSGLLSNSLRPFFHCQSLSGLQRLLLRIWLMLSEDFNSEKMPGITHFYFDGEELTVKNGSKTTRTFPTCPYYQCLRPNRSDSSPVSSCCDRRDASDSQTFTNRLYQG